MSMYPELMVLTRRMALCLADIVIVLLAGEYIKKNFYRAWGCREKGNADMDLRQAADLAGYMHLHYYRSMATAWCGLLVS